MVVQVTCGAAALIVVLGLHLGATEALYTNCGEYGSLQVGQSYIITTPYYPHPYPGLAFCRWTVSTPENTIVNLYCQQFDVNRDIFTNGCTDKFYFSPSGDIMNGDSEIYCGKIYKLYRNTTTNKFDVYFTSAYKDVDYDNYDYFWYDSHASGFQCEITVLRDILPATPEASSTVDETFETFETVPSKPEASSTVNVPGTKPVSVGTTVPSKPEESSTVDVPGTKPAVVGTTVPSKPEASSTVDVTGTKPAVIGTTVPA